MWSTLINQLINILLIEYRTLLIEYKTKATWSSWLMWKGIWQNPIIFLDKKYSKKKPENRKELVHLGKGMYKKHLHNGEDYTIRNTLISGVRQECSLLPLLFIIALGSNQGELYRKRNIKEHWYWKEVSVDHKMMMIRNLLKNVITHKQLWQACRIQDKYVKINCISAHYQWTNWK